MLTIQEVIWETFRLINYAAIGILPYKTWKYFYDTYKEEKDFCDEESLYHKRHNCVVTFSKGRSHIGWCGIQELNLNIYNVKSVYEPFLYFIDTAQKSLDVAIMSLNVKCIIESLIAAHKRGVNVRVISNFYMDKNSLQLYKQMERNGILITLYVSKEKSNSIMHTKYIVKDYCAQKGGHLLTGSFNLTDVAFSNNYEDVVFTSQRIMVEDFKKNFSKMWDSFKEDNTQMFNRLVLENAGFCLGILNEAKM
ncbi:mitochondrial cardiolipin hydrolase-like [Coccinella septempunctata]|uniref:mitochondrial cardiolipin hydrolase-like n=1 Tax=Coccinella septempunctata TaxID=41139 RepID=UPI001D074232|nr:mitochondrial cardiolipin hydrolase-like [Coccinella septempunctata]